jgi:hypothetical protein
MSILCTNIDRKGNVLFGKNFMENIRTILYRKDGSYHKMYMGINSNEGFKLITDGIDLSARLKQQSLWFCFGKLTWNKNDLRRLDDNHFIVAVVYKKKTYYNAYDFQTLTGLIDSYDVTKWFDGYCIRNEYSPYYKQGSEWVSFSRNGKWNYFHVPTYSFIDIPENKWFDMVIDDPTFSNGYELVGVKVINPLNNKEEFRFNYINPKGELLYKERDKTKWFCPAASVYIKDHTYVGFDGKSKKEYLLTHDGKIHNIDKNGNRID